MEAIKFLKLVCPCDSDFKSVGEEDADCNGRPTARYIFKFGKVRGSICRQTRKKPTVAFSSCEANFGSRYTRSNVFESLLEGSIMIQRIIFFREKIEDKAIQLQYILSEELAKDLLTKPLAQPKVEKHRCYLPCRDSSSKIIKSECGCSKNKRSKTFHIRTCSKAI